MFVWATPPMCKSINYLDHKSAVDYRRRLSMKFLAIFFGLPFHFLSAQQMRREYTQNQLAKIMNLLKKIFFSTWMMINGRKLHERSTCISDGGQKMARQIILFPGNLRLQHHCVGLAGHSLRGRIHAQNRAPRTVQTCGLRGRRREHWHARGERALGGQDDAYKEECYELATTRGCWFDESNQSNAIGGNRACWNTCNAWWRRGEAEVGFGRMALRELAVVDYIHWGRLVTVLWDYYMFYYGTTPYLLCFCYSWAWRLDRFLFPTEETPA